MVIDRTIFESLNRRRLAFAYPSSGVPHADIDRPFVFHVEIPERLAFRLYALLCTLILTSTLLFLLLVTAPTPATSIVTAFLSRLKNCVACTLSQIRIVCNFRVRTRGTMCISSVLGQVGVGAALWTQFAAHAAFAKVDTG